MRYKSVLLFGAPGSGKGTQGKILGSVPGFYHSACGDVFRTLDLQSELGRTFWEFSSRGELVPDEITVGLWRNYIAGMSMVNQFHPSSEILVLDGIPRNKRQAELLDDTLEVMKVIYLVCSDLKKMVERLRRRALKENRFDDANDKVIQNRLEVYEHETKPVLEHYGSDQIVKVDATMSQLQVLNELIKVLVPVKSQIDHATDTQRRAGLTPMPSMPQVILQPAMAMAAPEATPLQAPPQTAPQTSPQKSPQTSSQISSVSPASR